METNWAEENLKTIRTLMERSAIYRRALAPIMLFVGALGVASASIGILCRLDSLRAFGALWLGTAVVALAGALLIARRQALKDKEAFWSPPTRRVAQALIPPLLAGMCLGAYPVFVFTEAPAVWLWHQFSCGFFFTVAPCTPPGFSCHAGLNYLDGFSSPALVFSFMPL